MDFSFLGYSAIQWATLATAALIIGFSKTGMPGAGTLATPLVAFALPAKASTGMILPMLIVGDIFAVAFYRRHADWRHLAHLLPWAMAGIVAGYFALKVVTDAQLKPIMGVMILALLVVDFARKKLSSFKAPLEEPVAQEAPKRPKANAAFAGLMGTIAGCMTMMANAAGAVVSIYLLMMRLPKAVFVGTAAWFFLIVNCSKIPFSANLGLVNKDSLTINLTMAPLIVIGALVGVRTLKHIPEQTFQRIVLILTALAAIKLIF